MFHYMRTHQIQWHYYERYGRKQIVINTSSTECMLLSRGHTIHIHNLMTFKCIFGSIVLCLMVCSASLVNTTKHATAFNWVNEIETTDDWQRMGWIEREREMEKRPHRIDVNIYHNCSYQVRTLYSHSDDNNVIVSKASMRSFQGNVRIYINLKFLHLFVISHISVICFTHLFIE